MNEAVGLAALLVGGLILWSIACFTVHGPVILAYIAIQIATSGIFSLEMLRIEKLIPKRQSSPYKIGNDDEVKYEL